MELASDALIPGLYVDFNELLESDLVLLSQHDTRQDAKGNTVHLYEGLIISIFSDDVDGNGNPDNLVAEGVVERNRNDGWAKHVKWCRRIGSQGIRHQSDLIP
jgi:hypothetical protein